MEETKAEMFVHVIYHLKEADKLGIKSNDLIKKVRESVTANLNVDEITKKSIESEIASAISQGIANSEIIYEPGEDALYLGKIDETYLNRLSSLALIDLSAKKRITKGK